MPYIIIDNQLRHVGAAGHCVIIAPPLADIHLKYDISAPPLIVLNIEMTDTRKPDAFQKMPDFLAQFAVTGIGNGIIIADQLRCAVVHQDFPARYRDNLVPAVGIGTVDKHGIILALNVFLENKFALKSGGADIADDIFKLRPVLRLIALLLPGELVICVFHRIRGF